mgnify:CR=1
MENQFYFIFYINFTTTGKTFQFFLINKKINPVRKKSYSFTYGLLINFLQSET